MSTDNKGNTDSQVLHDITQAATECGNNANADIADTIMMTTMMIMMMLAIFIDKPKCQQVREALVSLLKTSARHDCATHMSVCVCDKCL